MILRLNSFIRHKLVYDIIKFYIFTIPVARRYYITIEPFSGMVFFLSDKPQEIPKEIVFLLIFRSFFTAYFIICGQHLLKSVDTSSR